MLIKNWKKEIWSIPNMLSMFRLLLIPAYIFIYLNAEQKSDYFLAAGILAVSCLTDLVDGKVARQFNMVTTLGKLLDPLADKVTQLTLILCLAIRHHFLWYLVAVFLVKESFQLIAGGINWHKGKILKGALMSGKICTAVLFISLIILVMLPDIETSAANAIITIDILFMLISFTNYLFTYFNPKHHFQSLDPQTDNDNGAA